MTKLPMLLVFIVQSRVSMQRINKYMNSQDIPADSVTHDATESDPIVIENGESSPEQTTSYSSMIHGIST